MFLVTNEIETWLFIAFYFELPGVVSLMVMQYIYCIYNYNN